MTQISNDICCKLATTLGMSARLHGCAGSNAHRPGRIRDGLGSRRLAEVVHKVAGLSTSLPLPWQPSRLVGQRLRLFLTVSYPPLWGTAAVAKPGVTWDAASQGEASASLGQDSDTGPAIPDAQRGQTQVPVRASLATNESPETGLAPVGLRLARACPATEGG